MIASPGTIDRARRWLRTTDRSALAAVLALAAVIAAAATGCTDDTDPPWQLDHDRIIAVRATPPRVASGEHATIDGLIGFKGAPVAELDPDTVTVASPASLAAAVSHATGEWIVTAPDAAQLAAARAGLGLAADAPVPLSIDVAYAGGALRATKTVWLGASAANPEMAAIEIDHATAAAPGADIVIAPDTKIPLSVGFDDVNYDVTWLSSCGTMHDFDLPAAYLRVEPDDPTTGQLALVVRDAGGGVTWRIWPIRTQ